MYLQKILRNLNKFSILFLFIFYNSFAITLEEAVQKTLKQSNEIKKIESDLSSVTGNKTSNFAKTFLPEVDYRFTKTKTDPNETDLFSKTEKAFVASYNVSNLYKGSLNYLSGNASLNVKKFTSQQEKTNLIIEVIKIYLKVLETQKTIELLEKSLTLNKQILEQARIKFNSGSVRKTSVLLAESQMEEIIANIELAKNQLIIDKNRFLLIVGEKAESLMEPPLPVFSYSKLEDFLENIKKNNNALKSSESQKNAKKYDLAYVSSDFLPDISISYQKYSAKDSFFLSKEDSGSRIVLSAKFYLYKPGLISSVIQKSYDFQSSKQQNLINFKEILTNAQDLWSKYEYYNAITPSKERLVKVRAMIARDFTEDYKYGRVQLSDALDEETKFTEAELDLLKIKFKKMLNIFEMKSMLGEIDFF
jgi:outer membrane protein TolC